MNFSLKGRAAIVTGASRGIGFATASTLAAHGADLVLVARDASDTLHATAAGLADEHGVTVEAVRGDVAEPATAKAAAQLAFKRFRRLDILVNNAGVLEDARIGMIADETIDNSLAINLKSVLLFTQASARLMTRNGGGSIVNVSSIIGRVGNAGQMLYGATKAGIIGATLSAAKELAPQQIRVNAVAPGYIDTHMIRALDEAVDRQRRASIGLQRVGSAEDVAASILFLSGNLSTYVTGQVLGVDGGMLI